MKVTIEKVDKLVERADVGYEVAKDALERANGDLLDAVILLEREGKLGPGAGHGRTKVYTTESGMSPSTIGQSYGEIQTRVEPNFTAGSSPGGQDGRQYGSQHQYKDESAQFEDGVKKFFMWLGRLIRGGCINYFEVWRRGERILYFPVILFLLCLVHWVFWVFLAFILIGLLCGCRYRFSGPHLGKESVNDTADEAKSGENERN